MWKKRLLLVLKVNEFKILSADKGNATVVLSMANYNRKIAVLLGTKHMEIGRTVLSVCVVHNKSLEEILIF